MASPLCVTFTVIIIIIISSEVSSSIGNPADHEGTGGDQVDGSVEVNLAPSAPRQTTYTRCNLQFTMTYGYSRFHIWSNYIQYNQSAKGETSRGATLHFRVRASSDAHILLSSTDDPDFLKGTPLYEIVLGAGRNTFSDIRRAQRTGTKATIQTPDLLSGRDPRGFWIRVSNDGAIMVGKEGEDAPFMAWQDPDPIQIKYFAFCTWNGVLGKWEYNCPDFVTNSEPEPDPEVEAQKKMTPDERLRRDLLLFYDPYTTPTLNYSVAKPVHVHLQSDMIEVNEAKSTFTVHGTFTMLWEDEKLKWDPKNYENITHLRLKTFGIWVPELILYNAADGKGTDLFGHSYLLVLDHNGTVTWETRTALKTICTLELHLWPFDWHTCPITIGTWAQTGKIHLSTYTDPHFSHLTYSAWDLDSLTVQDQPLAMFHPYVEEKYYSDEDMEEEIEYLDSNPAIEFTATIRRRNSLYIWTVYIPITVAALFISISYWMDPTKSHRLIFCLICLMLIFGTMIMLFRRLPGGTNKCPNIILTYTNGLLLAVFAIFITVIITTINEHKFESLPPVIVTKILLHLPNMVKSGPQAYSENGNAIQRARKIFTGMDHQPLDNDFDEKTQEDEDVSSLSEADIKAQWIQIANVIDLIAFIASTLFIAFALC